jgi:hypothetical protein
VGLLSVWDRTGRQTGRRLFNSMIKKALIRLWRDIKRIWDNGRVAENTFTFKRKQEDGETQQERQILKATLVARTCYFLTRNSQPFRYIEVFKSSSRDLQLAQGRNGGSGGGGGGPMRNARSGGPRASPYGGPPAGRAPLGGYGGSSGPAADSGAGLDESGQYKHIVHMRGLPYRATEQELSEFFLPINTLAVRIIFNR